MRLIFTQVRPTLSESPPVPHRDVEIPYDEQALERLCTAHDAAYLRAGIAPRAFVVGRRVYVSLKARIAQREERGRADSYVFVVGSPDEVPHVHGLPVYLDPDAKDDSVVATTGLEGLNPPHSGR